ncbi:MAG: type VI secretion system baseplate subunit TssE [Gemmatimonadota bacterium]
MVDKRIGEGARALLFERLTDESPRARTEPRPLRTHDARGLRASVLQRLMLLLNTRATRPRPRDGRLTVLDYGLPDYSSQYTRDPGTRARLASEITSAIAAFEPRLEVTRVAVEPLPTSERALGVVIEGLLRSEHTTEPVSFSVPLNGSAGEEIQAS